MSGSEDDSDVELLVGEHGGHEDYMSSGDGSDGSGGSSDEVDTAFSGQ